MSHLPATTTPTALELSTPGLTEALAERWLLSLPSANTRAAYRRDLAAFASWCAEQGATPLEAGRYELDAYRDHLAQLGRKPATIARALSALSSFYEYALDAAPQLLSANPAARVKRPKVSAESSTLGLSKAEAEAFLAAARASSATDYALGCLLLLNGLRVSEALGLDVADYYPEGEHYVAEVLGKGGRVDKVALARRTLAALAAVTEDREAGPVFTDAAGERMNRHQATRVVGRLARGAGAHPGARGRRGAGRGARARDRQGDRRGAPGCRRRRERRGARAGGLPVPGAAAHLSGRRHAVPSSRTSVRLWATFSPQA